MKSNFSFFYFVTREIIPYLMDNGKIVCFLIINPPTIILLFSFLTISSLKFTSLQFYFVAIKLF